jgi:hypothetical protein
MRDMHAFAAALSGSGWAMPSAGVVVAPAPDQNRASSHGMRPDGTRPALREVADAAEG